MTKTNSVSITKEQYDFALARVEELLLLVDDNTPANDKNAVELTVMSDIVIVYEKEHYPIAKPTVSELIERGSLINSYLYLQINRKQRIQHFFCLYSK